MTPTFWTGVGCILVVVVVYTFVHLALRDRLPRWTRRMA